MLELEHGEIINVDDIIVVSTCLGYKQFKVTRVTKTLALSKRKDGYEHKFKRVCDFNMSHPYSQNTNLYMVLRGDS